MCVDLYLYHLYLSQGSLGVEIGLPWFIHMLLPGYGFFFFLVVFRAQLLHSPPSAIRMVLFADLRLLIFLLAILIPL